MENKKCDFIVCATVFNIVNNESEFKKYKYQVNRFHLPILNIKYVTFCSVCNLKFFFSYFSLYFFFGSSMNYSLKIVYENIIIIGIQVV